LTNSFSIHLSNPCRSTTCNIASGLHFDTGWYQGRRRCLLRVSRTIESSMAETVVVT